MLKRSSKPESICCLTRPSCDEASSSLTPTTAIRPVPPQTAHSSSTRQHPEPACTLLQVRQPALLASAGACVRNLLKRCDTSLPCVKCSVRKTLWFCWSWTEGHGVRIRSGRWLKQKVRSMCKKYFFAFWDVGHLWNLWTSPHLGQDSKTKTKKNKESNFQQRRRTASSARSVSKFTTDASKLKTFRVKTEFIRAGKRSENKINKMISKWFFFH